MIKSDNWSCYLLRSLDSNKTYIGSTNNFPARLIKHNSSKGAKYTMGQAWIPILVIHGFHHKNACLSFESGWKRLSKPKKRINQKLEPFRLMSGLTNGLTDGLTLKYSHGRDDSTTWNRIMDLLYFVYNFTLLDTKYVLNDPIKLPINQPEYHLVEIFTLEEDLKLLPWPYFMEFIENDF